MLEIHDTNGNFIDISYRGGWPPAIDAITDTVRRVIKFNYDNNNRLVTITAPGLGDSNRELIRLHYGVIKIDPIFSQTLERRYYASANPGPIEVPVIDAIHFRETGTGYWFGDQSTHFDYYSGYGMIRRVSQRRGMTSSTKSLTEQGTITSGIMTREQEYNYADKHDPPLQDPPKYDKMTERWEGMDPGMPPAETLFRVQPDGMSWSPEMRQVAQ
jgi:hypothetical protein